MIDPHSLLRDLDWEAYADSVAAAEDSIAAAIMDEVFGTRRYGKNELDQCVEILEVIPASQEITKGRVHLYVDLSMLQYCGYRSGSRRRVLVIATLINVNCSYRSATNEGIGFVLGMHPSAGWRVRGLADPKPRPLNRFR